MSAFGKAADMLGALRASADGALQRLSGATEKPRPAADFSPPDPTRAFMPGERDDSEPERTPPLSSQLETSAAAMKNRADALRRDARALAERIEERRQGEITMAAQALRVIISLAWLGVAVWLYNATLNARADSLAAIAGGAPLDDVSVLMQVFFIIAAAGLGVAFAVAALTRLLGKADDGEVHREAQQLGRKIAETANEFDATLTTLRAAMDKRSPSVDAVDELSRAYLTALEAHVFFREIDFLASKEDSAAARQFQEFLQRAAKNEDNGGPFSMLLSLLSGAVIGAMGVYLAMAPKAETASDAAQSALAFTHYPWAAQLLLLGGIAYAGAGVFLSLAADPLTAGTAKKARAQALLWLRSSFTAESPLLPDDVARRIKEALDVFRARAGGGASRALSGGVSANHAAADEPENDSPQWRRRDSSVKFVASSFSPAPSPFRTDAFAKKFSAAEEGKSGSKRGGENLKNRSRD